MSAGQQTAMPCGFRQSGNAAPLDRTNTRQLPPAPRSPWPKELGSATNEEWRAIAARDRRSDAKFVWVALSTYIYCRPSCGARRPPRQAVLVLPTAAAAERRGYSACRRCCPATTTLSSGDRSIRSALDYIQNHSDEAITLPHLSQAVGLSPHHLQRLFRRIVGISPRDYSDYRRLQRLKSLLKGGGSVTDAAYAAGYGSIRALYERGARNLGMTPATYRDGGAGVSLRYAIIASALGRVLVVATNLGVCTVLVRPTDELLVAELAREMPRATAAPEVVIPFAWTAAVRACEDVDPLLSTLPALVDIFQARLMRTLSPSRPIAFR